MSDIPARISYGMLIESLERRINNGWDPDDVQYVQELLIQLVFAQRSVLKQAARRLYQHFLSTESEGVDA